MDLPPDDAAVPLTVVDGAGTDPLLANVRWADSETGFDRELFRVQWDALYAHHVAALPSGTLMTVNHLDDRIDDRKMMRSAITGPTFNDVSREIAKCAGRFNVWHGVNFMSPKLSEIRREPKKSGSRGGSAEVSGVVALYADIDLADPGHKRSEEVTTNKRGDLVYPNPDLAGALSFAKNLVLDAGLLVHTGGGLHFYAPLAAGEMLDPANDPAHDALMKRWAKYLEAKAAVAKIGWDKGIAQDPARVLRTMGTYNRKLDKARPTGLISVDPSVRYTIAQLEDLIPQLPVAQIREPREIKLRNITPRTGGTAVVGDDTRPGVVLAAGYPVGDLLADAFGWLREGDGVTMPRDDGSFSDEPHGKLNIGGEHFTDDYERVTIFGARGIDFLGLDDQFHSLTSWDLLVHLCGGQEAGGHNAPDTIAAAARIAALYVRDGAEALVNLLQANETPKELRAAVPARAALVALPILPALPAANTSVGESDVFGGDVVEDALSTEGPLSIWAINPSGDSARYAITEPPVTWNQALEAGTGWTPVLADESRRTAIFARIGGEHCGLWRMKIRSVAGEGGGRQQYADYDRITDWVAWRSSCTSTWHGLQKRKTDADTFVVKIITKAGARPPIDMDAPGSLNPAKIQEATSAPIALPPYSDLNDVRTMLAVLGHEDRVDEMLYDSTGWIVDADGYWLFAAPAGSVSAAGIRHDITVAAAGNSATTASTGWDRVPTTPQEHRAGIEALAALMTITPRRKDWGIGNLGMLCAAPLALSVGTTLMVQGVPGSGKTLGARLVYSALSSIGLSALPVGIPIATAAGVGAVLAWSRHLLLPCDDYRRGAERSDESKNTVAGNVLERILQGSYGRDGGNKSQQNGKARDSEQFHALGLVTSEVFATGRALMERLAVIKLAKGDMDMSADGAVNRFKASYANTGLTRQGFAGFLQHLAAKMDGELGGLAGLTAWSDAKKDHYYNLFAAERAGENIAVIATGWAAFREYAESVGSSDLLPTEIEVQRVLLSMVRDTTEEHRQTDIAPQIFDAIGTMISSATGHITNCDGTVPLGKQLESGYKQVENAMGGAYWAPGGPVLGRYSKDYRHVLIEHAGVESAQKAAHLEGLHIRQIKDQVAESCVEGSDPGGRPPWAPYNVGASASIRKRGFLIEAALIGLYPNPQPEPEDVTEL